MSLDRPVSRIRFRFVPRRKSLFEKREYMKSYDIAVIGGDGTGPEVTRESIKVLDAAAAKFGFKLNYTDFDFGEDRYLRTNEALPDSAADDLRQFPAILLGAIGHPDVKPGILEKGILPQGASTKNAGFACFGSLSEIIDDLKTNSEEDVINFITDSAGKGDLQEIYETVYDELGMSSSFINSSIESTQRYQDLMEAVNEAVNRNVDLRVMTDIINSLK